MTDSSNSKRLLVGTGIYAVGTFGTKILVFLIAPLYTYYLATSEMGTYDVLISTINLLIPFISLQISDAVYRWIIRDDVNISLYIVTTFQFLLVGSLLFLVVYISINFFFDVPYRIYFVFSLFSALSFQIAQKIIRGLRNQWLFVLSGIIYTVVFLALNVIQLCVFHNGLESLFISYIIANLCGLVIIFILENRIRQNVFQCVNIKILRELLIFSIPLVPNYLSWWVIDSSDRYIVLYFLGVSSNGILAIAHKFPTIIQSLFGLFLNSWQDLSISNEESDRYFYTNVFEWLYRLSFMSLWILVPMTKIFIMIIMENDYKISCNYIPFYYLGAIFQAFSSFYGVGYIRTKNTKGAFSSSVYAAIFNAVINIALIKMLGLQAAAISTCIAFFIMWIVRLIHNKGDLQIKINWKQFILLLIVDILICVISILRSGEENILLLIFGCLLFGIFGHREMIIVTQKIKSVCIKWRSGRE